MKRLVTIIGILALLCSQAIAIDWTTANQSTVGWDAVTMNVEGVPIPVGDTIQYDLYLVKESSVDRETDKIKKGTTDELQYIFTFNQEGRWLAGIQAVRTPAASPEDKKYSTLIWSDNADASLVPKPFGFVYFASPADPGGFGPK
jgi:hypothetical protein